MKYALTTLALFMLSPALAADACTANPDQLGAVYQITRLWHNITETVTEQEELVLWRAPHRAAHQHRAQESTELWEQGADGRVRLVRLFDQHQRGIEYQPDEVKSRQKETWQLRRELVTAEMLDPDNLLESKGSGCTRTEQYHWERNGTVHELEWLPQLRLVNDYREQGNGRSVNWQLKQGIYDADEVTGFFKRIDAYQTTDYADIGDMESDPFLRQMIRLGFIADPHDNHRGD